MENLKSVLADKIIDVSAEGGDDLKIRIDKIQRFRDFTLACQTLINKYPPIEDELIRMVRSNDFDTKTASARVDTIIRLAENLQQQQQAKPQVEEEKELPLSNTEMEESYTENIEDFQHEELENHYEDVETEDVDSYEYAEFEEDASITPTPTPFTESNEEEIVENTNSTESKQKEKIRRILQVIGIAIAVVALIFIVKFVIKHWETILYVLGGAVALAILVWILIKRNKNK